VKYILVILRIRVAIPEDAPRGPNYVFKNNLCFDQIFQGSHFAFE